MKLPFLKSFKKKVEVSYFLVLILRTEKANAVIFEEQEGKVRIVGQKEEYFEHSIEVAPVEEFLDVLDKAISAAESSLPVTIETQKTIFGVKDDWAEHNQIKKEYLLKLKKASDELGLTPIGFLVIPQAISHLLQKDEGAPISAILVDAGNTFATVSLIRAGRIIESKTSEIHDSIAYTVDTLLKHFETAEILPSRIIIFNSGEDLSQEFIGHTWSKSLPFLHLPQITNLPTGVDARAVLLGAATQMGFEVLGSPKEEIVPKTPDLEQELPKENLTQENFGFVKDQDVGKSQEIAKSEIPAEEEIVSTQIEEKKPLTATLLTHLGKVTKIAKHTTSTLLKSIKKIPLGKLPALSSFAGRGKILLGIIGAIVILSVILLFYFFGTSATITLDVQAKIITQDKTISFSTTSPTDFGKNIVSAEIVSVSKEGTISKPATGKKEIGTNAKGAVTIFNISDNKVSFPSGTTITSANGLKFTLDNAVTVASGSGDAISGTKPSTVTVNVTAGNIGTEYNLPSNVKFSIGSNSLVAAKNDNPFSQGSKKEVTVVSSNDVKKLEEDLPKQLEKDAKSDLAKQIASNQLLLPAFLNTTIEDEKLNHKVSEEAKEVTLTGRVIYQGLSYDKKDFNAQAAALLRTDLSQNLTLDPNNIKVDVKTIEQKKDKDTVANLAIKALLLPKIDEEKIKKEISGKSVTYTQDQLSKLPQVQSVTVKRSPAIPLLPKRIPSLVNHIEFIIQIHE